MWQCVQYVQGVQCVQGDSVRRVAVYTGCAGWQCVQGGRVCRVAVTVYFSSQAFIGFGGVVLF